jgi:predicted phage terminase large subunit-like protein
MERMMLPVFAMKPVKDKRSRLQVVAPYIKNGTVLFPRTGCEQLLGQVFNLGVESHDDLVDGLTYLLQGLADQGLELPKIQWIEG